MGFWGDFQGLTEATGGGRGSKNAKLEATSFMDGPLHIKAHEKAPSLSNFRKIQRMDSVTFR